MVSSSWQCLPPCGAGVQTRGKRGDMSAASGRAEGAAAIRWNVLGVSVLAAMVEGYDAQVLAYVAPLISREWALAPGAFRGTFSVGLLGLMLGCMFIAPLSDRIG